MAAFVQAGRRFLRWLGWHGAAFVAVCVVAQCVALVDVLGYEYSVLLSLLTSLLGGLRVVDRLGGWEGNIAERTGRAGIDLLALNALGVVISLANMVRVTNCEPATGLLYALVFGVGAIPMAVATGVVLRVVLQRRAAMAAVVSLVLVSIAASVSFIALQPPIVFWSTVAGYFAGSIYDESLVGMAPHITFRLWNAACAIALLALVAWYFERRRGAVTVAVTLLLGAVVAWTQRGDLGWEKNRAYIERELAGFVATEHFDIHFDAKSFRAGDVELLAYDHEARFALLRDFFGTEPAGRLRSFVYGGAGRRGDLMGGRRTLVAKIWLGEMHITWDGIGDGMLGHEMAHLFLRDAGRGPLRVSSADGLLPLMALVEGAASAAAWDASDLDDHAWSAAMVALDIAPDLAELLGPTGFWSQNSARAYTLTSSFSRWLVETRGAAAYLRVYRNGDFDAAYGVPLDALVAQWRDWLASDWALEPSTLAVAQWRFDRPSLLGKRCGRALATRLDRGQELLAGRQLDEARRCFLSVVADDPDNVGYRLRAARVLRQIGDLPAANEQIEWVLAQEGAGRAAQMQARELLGDIAFDAAEQGGGTHDAASTHYRSALAEAATPADLRRLQAKLAATTLADEAPATTRAVYRALVVSEAPPNHATVAELLLAAGAEEPGSTLATYLAALRLIGSDSPAAIELIDELDMSTLAPEQRLWARRAHAWQLTRLGRSTDACAAWGQLHAAAARGSALAAESQQWLARCRLGIMWTGGVP